MVPQSETCGDHELRSTSVRAGDGRRDWRRCGAPAVYRIGSSSVCEEHYRKRRDRGDDVSVIFRIGGG
jgi:hypothetical protein